MIKRIKTHNLLNGIVFSIVEFAIIAAVIIPFAIYYIFHVQVFYALVSVGIIINCLSVAILGIRQWNNKEQEIGWQRLYSKQGLLDKQVRERIDRENPHLLRDTIIITVTTLIPYVLLLLTIFDLFTHRGERKP